jgi:hypothetical protein
MAPIATPEIRPATIAQNSDQVCAVLQAALPTMSSCPSAPLVLHAARLDRSLAIIGVPWLAADSTQK